MTTNEKRAAIARVYSSESWQQKVKNMSDAQVVAIYQKFLANGKFNCEPLRRVSSIAVNIGKALKEKSNMALVGNKGYKEDAEQLVMDGFKKTGRAGNSR